MFHLRLRSFSFLLFGVVVVFPSEFPEVFPDGAREVVAVRHMVVHLGRNVPGEAAPILRKNARIRWEGPKRRATDANAMETS